MVKEKVLVIGLDGATFDVLKPLVKKFGFTNLSSLIQEGASGALRSVFPPITAPAWVSFMTGKNPGKHGVIDFVDVVQGSKNIAGSRSIQSETIWSILNSEGGCAGLINVPVTYPPYEIGGFMISGMPTPEVNVCYSFPPSLGPELEGILGNYMVIVPWMRYSGKNMEKFLIDVIHCTRQRGKYTLHLMKNHAWNFFMVVFNGTDIIAHALWDVIEDLCRKPVGTPQSESERLIVMYFEELDRIIGAMCELADNDTTIFVVSDHGFGPMKKKVHINNWLNQMGLLSIDFSSLRKKELVLKLRKAISPFAGSLRRLLPRRRPRPMRYADIFQECIRWDKTHAFSASRTQQGIYINVKGRQPNGIVEPGREYETTRDLLIERLTALPDPETGMPMRNEIYKREELYSGPYVEYAPDVMFMLQGGEYQADDLISENVIETCNWRMKGTHRMEGVLAVKGKNIKPGWGIKDAQIIDLAPTILYLLGIPIPDDMDGRVLVDVFTEDFVDAHSIKYSGTRPKGHDQPAHHVYAPEETELISEKLRNLGYFD